MNPSTCRYENAPGDELILAAAEQQKITELRLCALVEPKETMAERRTGQILAHVQGRILERGQEISILTYYLFPCLENYNN